MPRFQGFTLTYNQHANDLKTEVFVGPGFNPDESKTPTHGDQYHGIWDTGATGSVITKKVVKECGLIPFSVRRVVSVGKTSDALEYLVAIGLPNGVGIPMVRVTEAEYLGGGADLLIGMDIICTGDFSITNINGKTTFSFRIPSMERVDFVEEANGLRTLFPYLGIAKNTACPCGSRSKFKNCHGKVKR